MTDNNVQVEVLTIYSSGQLSLARAFSILSKSRAAQLVGLQLSAYDVVDDHDDDDDDLDITVDDMKKLVVLLL